jgi:hypothetical protein
LERALQSPVRLDQDFVVFAVDLEFGRDGEDGAGMRRSGGSSTSKVLKSCRRSGSGNW